MSFSTKVKEPVKLLVTHTPDGFYVLDANWGTLIDLTAYKTLQEALDTWDTPEYGTVVINKDKLWRDANA